MPSLKVRAAPAWQSVPSQCGLCLPMHSSALDTQLCSGCKEVAGGSTEPSLVLPLLPSSLPWQANALPSPSPAPCSYDQEKNWSRAHMTTEMEGQLASPKSQPSASCLVGCTIQHHAPAQMPCTVQRIRLRHHSVSPGPNSIPPSASTAHHSDPGLRASLEHQLAGKILGFQDPL